MGPLPDGAGAVVALRLHAAAMDFYLVCRGGVTTGRGGVASRLLMAALLRVRNLKLFPTPTAVALNRCLSVPETDTSNFGLIEDAPPTRRLSPSRFRDNWAPAEGAHRWGDRQSS